MIDTCTCGVTPESQETCPMTIAYRAYLDERERLRAIERQRDENGQEHP